MVITHSVIKNPGEKGYASEWNAEHIFDDENRALRGSSFIVAASDSRDKERADYVCDGTADEVEINTAINNLPAGGGGIQLLEGTYDINSSIIISKNNVSIEGMGSSTIIQTVGDIFGIHADTKTGISISRLKIRGSGAGNPMNVGILFENVTESRITGVWVTWTSNTGILVYYSEGVIISDCRVWDGRAEGMYFSGCEKCSMVNNSVHDMDWEGMGFGQCESCILLGNLIYQNGRNGVFFSFTNNSIVSNNQIKDNDYANTATYDGIRLLSSDRNILLNNRCMDNDRYEINISNAACDKNLVLGNIVYGTDHVGAIQDLGTGTELAHNITT